MRAILIAAFGTFLLAAPAGAEEPCRTLPDGGWRCKEPDGHVTERRPDGEGGARTTSTDPRSWGTSDGHGRGVTPPDSMIRNSPTLRREAWGRVTDPWEPRTAPAQSVGGWRTPRAPTP